MQPLVIVILEMRFVCGEFRCLGPVGSNLVKKLRGWDFTSTPVSF